MTKQRAAGFDDNDNEIFEDLPEILCCPRCGEKADWEEEDWDSWFIICLSCGYYNTSEGFESLEELAEWWNERPYIDRLLKEIYELGAEIDILTRKYD
jgi:hypothetical protein